MNTSSRFTEQLSILVLLIYFLIFVPYTCGAATGPTYYEHPDLMQIIIGGLFALVLWYTAKTLKKIDTNQNEIFQRLRNVEIGFAELHAEHKMKVGTHK